MTVIIGVDVRTWRSALRDAVELPISSRGVLFVLGQWMNTDGTNAWPGRSRLAASCQVSESSIDRHLTGAIAAGYLERTTPGSRGHVATYRATIPAYHWDDVARKLVQPMPVRVPQSDAPVTRKRGQKAAQTRAESGANAGRKRRTSAAPTSKYYLEEHLVQSRHLSNAREMDGMNDIGLQVQVPERDDDNPDGFPFDSMNWVTAQLGGTTLDEANVVIGMLEDGANRAAVLDRIRGDRRALTGNPA